MTRPNKKSLPQLTREIKTFEKGGIKSVIEIGRRLTEAHEQHSEKYVEWLDRDFSWTYRTALRYRHAYEFATNKLTQCHFSKLNISISALHLVANPNTPEKARTAIIKAAMKGRVSLTDAQNIIDKLDDPPPTWKPPG